ncbi:hypothetical protein [Mycoplasma sp. P36-A1]|uniref:hypothetical protein n=1 Tax=Mycoplasma sp. P36-A1 TaxID=3252900 RepID=UPI003C300B42
MKIFFSSILMIIYVILIALTLFILPNSVHAHLSKYTALLLIVPSLALGYKYAFNSNSDNKLAIRLFIVIWIILLILIALGIVNL